MKIARLAPHSGPEMFRKSAYSRSENCHSGHVNGFSPVCGGNACLRILRIKNNGSSSLKNESIRRSDRGLLDFVPPDLLSHLTYMQWSCSIYGSLGHVGLDFLTSRFFVDAELRLGERLFLCNHRQFHQTSGWYLFLDEMKDHGIEFNHSDSTKRIYDLKSSEGTFAKEDVLHLDLPAFRIFRISNFPSINATVTTIENVACVIREGGLIIIEKFQTASIKHAVRRFFKLHRHTAFVPLIVSDQRFIMCSLRFHVRFMKYIKENLARHHNLREADTVYFGKDLKYFVEGK